MSISLNDHEQRIKDVELKIPNISDRITELENVGGVVKFDSSQIKGLSLYGEGQWKDITSMIPYKFTSNTLVSIKGSIRYAISGAWRPSTDCSNGMTKVEFQTSVHINRSAANFEGYIYIKASSSGISIGVTDLRSAGNVDMQFTGIWYFIEDKAKNLYYKFLDKCNTFIEKLINSFKMTGGEFNVNLLK